MNPIILMTALSLSLVAGFYSIVGLATIFAAAMIPVIIMGTVLEVGKLVTTVFLHQNWKELQWKLKTYLVIAVMSLMFITSMGIFGYLSKAHIEQSIQMGGNNEIQVSSLERQIANQDRIIKDAEQVVSQLDNQVQTLIDYDRIRGPSGSIAVRQSQAEEREILNTTINQAYGEIEALQEKLLPLKRERLSLEAEVGPLKYIAELVYGDEANDHFDEAVRWVIILIIFVFDPLAVSLLIAWSWMNEKEKKEWDEFQKEPEKEIVEVEKIVEVPVEKIVEKIVTKEVPVEVVKEVIKEVPVPQQEVDLDYFDKGVYSDKTRKDQNKKNRLESNRLEPWFPREPDQPKKK